MSGLLKQAADYFKRRQTGIQRWYSDDVGRYAFRVDPAETPDALVVTAKKDLHEGMASFQRRRVLERARDQGDLVALFTAADRWLVFDPEAVLNHGVEDATQSDRRRRRGEDWVDIDTDIAVPLGDYASGRKMPDSVDDIQPTGLHHYTEESDDA